MRVLVVEDQVDLGDVFRDYLFELGHQPVVVHSAEATLARLKTDRPDAILLDVQLPGMSGLDFLQLRPVRALGVPIVAVSGVVNESQRREIQNAQNIAQVFLGTNLKCASCHDSFVNYWKLTDAYSLASVFADSPLEIHRCDKLSLRVFKIGGKPQVVQYVLR